MCNHYDAEKKAAIGVSVRSGICVWAWRKINPFCAATDHPFDLCRLPKIAGLLMSSGDFLALGEHFLAIHVISNVNIAPAIRYSGRFASENCHSPGSFG
jgi:hypothetical protein